MLSCSENQFFQCGSKKVQFGERFIFFIYIYKRAGLKVGTIFCSNEEKWCGANRNTSGQMALDLGLHVYKSMIAQNAGHAPSSLTEGGTLALARSALGQCTTPPAFASSSVVFLGRWQPRPRPGPSSRLGQLVQGARMASIGFRA